MSKLGNKVEIRLTPDTQAKFEKVATTLNLAPLTIVQMALGLGLDAIGANPNVVVDELRRKMRGSSQ